MGVDDVKREYREFESCRAKLERDYTFLRDVSCGVWLPPAWYPVFDKLCATIERTLNADYYGDHKPTIEVYQVKAKFGQLRFYYKLHTDSRTLKAYVNGLVDMTAQLVPPLTQEKENE